MKHSYPKYLRIFSIMAIIIFLVAIVSAVLLYANVQLMISEISKSGMQFNTSGQNNSIEIDNSKTYNFTFNFSFNKKENEQNNASTKISKLFRHFVAFSATFSISSLYSVIMIPFILTKKKMLSKEIKAQGQLE